MYRPAILGRSSGLLFLKFFIFLIDKVSRWVIVRLWKGGEPGGIKMLFELKRGDKGHTLEVAYRATPEGSIDIQDVRLVDTLKDKEFGPNVVEMLTIEELKEIEYSVLWVFEEHRRYYNKYKHLIDKE